MFFIVKLGSNKICDEGMLSMTASNNFSQLVALSIGNSPHDKEINCITCAGLTLMP